MDRAILMAIGRLGTVMGFDLSGDRIAGIIESLYGRGFTVSQIENAIIELATCPKFNEKLRYGGTLTPADILEKAKEISTPVAVDPVRAMLNREKRQAQLEHGEQLRLLK